MQEPTFSSNRKSKIPIDFELLVEKKWWDDAIAYLMNRFWTPKFNHRVDSILWDSIMLDCYPDEFWKPWYLLRIMLNATRDDFVATIWDRDDRSTWVK